MTLDDELTHDLSLYIVQRELQARLAGDVDRGQAWQKLHDWLCRNIDSERISGIVETGDPSRHDTPPTR